jgi:hypothetical protein
MKRKCSESGNKSAREVINLEGRFWSNRSFKSGRADKTSFTVRRECEAGANIFAGKLRELHNNFSFSHARSQIFQNIINRYTGIPNTRLARTPRGIDGYERLLCHLGNMSQFAFMVKPLETPPPLTLPRVSRAGG